MKKLLFGLTFLLLLGIGSNLSAAGYSSWATPTTVELVSGGLLIHGEFGDPNNCGEANYIFIAEENKNYQSALSIALSALHSKGEMKIYASSCTSVSFHWSGDVINKHKDGEALYIR